MLILLETRSLSWAESVRIALLANGIEAVVLDQSAPSTLGLMGSLRVAIVNAADLPRAARLVADLQPPKTESLPSWRWHKRALVLLCTGFLLLTLVIQIAGSTSHPKLEFLITVASAVAFIGGFTLLFVGYRADSRKTTVESGEP